MNSLRYQCWPTLAVFGADGSSILLRPSDVSDQVSSFALLSGQMNHGDESIMGALKRLKDEQIGPGCRLRLLPTLGVNIHISKRDGNHLILPHYFAQHLHGAVASSGERPGFTWIPMDPAPITTFDPGHVIDVISKLRRVPEITDLKDCVEI